MFELRKFYLFIFNFRQLLGFSGGSVVKTLPPSPGGMDLIPGLGRSHAVANGNPFQDACVENPMNREPGGLQSMGLHRVVHDLATKE